MSRRRWHRFSCGEGTGRRIRAWWSSLGTQIGRRWSGGRRSTARRSSERSGNGGRQRGRLIQPGNDEIGLMDGWRRWRARLLGLGCEEIERSGEKWPGRSPATGSARLGSSRAWGRRGMNGIGYERRGERRSFEATAFVATADAWRAPTSRPAVTVAVWATQWSTGRNSSRVGLILTHA